MNIVTFKGDSELNGPGSPINRVDSQEQLAETERFFEQFFRADESHRTEAFRLLKEHISFKNSPASYEI
jgi:hypothetical protein